MSYWLYIQAVINLALVGACVYLYMGYRRVHSQGTWRQELEPLVETLGELLIEIERVSARSHRAVGKPLPTSQAAPQVPVAKAVVAEVPQAEPVQQSAPAPVAPVEAAPAKGAATPPSSVEPVLALAAQGIPAEEIARRLGRPIGEVSLVLGLRASSVALTA